VPKLVPRERSIMRLDLRDHNVTRNINRVWRQRRADR